MISITQLPLPGMKKKDCNKFCELYLHREFLKQAYDLAKNSNVNANTCWCFKSEMKILFAFYQLPNLGGGTYTPPLLSPPRTISPSPSPKSNVKSISSSAGSITISSSSTSCFGNG
mmetsp:Transcript_20136/g.22810  ORF Transcript_20136/g.22810 Transcript_20136/m.22810 type:complete len:116 (-) Transcript_20136:435-782(-)